MPLTNAQLRAEIDRLTQAMVDRSKVPSHLPKFTGKRGEDVREWLFQVENACRINGIAIEGASTRLPGIAGSAMEKPASGWFLHWSSTIRNEEHTWGIFPPTRSYVKLENPGTLSDAMDLAVKYEVTHFVEDARDRQIRSDKKKTVGDDNEKQPRRFKGKPFRGKGRFKPRAKSESKETSTCYFCKKPGHVKADCYAWKNEQAKQGNDKPRQ
uniref:CCHC-type domain-containing protein n=1 Tax=Phytophthora ramorum TaxID=164328 RepID=H3H879_PHYRM